MIMARVTKEKTGTMIGLIYLIVFLVFNMLVFFIFKEKNGIFWMSYIFAVIAFAVKILSTFLAFKSFEVEAAFFGIPLASLSVYYFFAQVFVSVIFMIFKNAPFKLAFAIQVIILAAFAIVAIITLFTRDAVQDVNDSIKINTTAIKTMQADVEAMMDGVRDVELRNRLRKLAETIRYSDPMSNDAVLDIEDQIMESISLLRVYCEDNDKENAMRACRDTEMLFLQRNRTLRATK